MHYQRARLCQRSSVELACRGLGEGELNARPAVERRDLSAHRCAKGDESLACPCSCACSFSHAHVHAHAHDHAQDHDHAADDDDDDGDDDDDAHDDDDVHANDDDDDDGDDDDNDEGLRINQSLVVSSCLF